MSVAHLIENITILRKLKNIGTKISYPRPYDEKNYGVSVLVFADPSCSEPRGQLGCIVGLLLAELRKHYIFHGVSWLSRKSKHPFKSMPLLKFLQYEKVFIYEKKLLHSTVNFSNLGIRVHPFVDFKDIFTKIST